MTEVEKKGIGKGKASLVVSAVLIVILAVSNVWSYTNLQDQINTLTGEKNNLQTQVNTLQSQMDSLNTTYQDYVGNHSYTDSEYNTLQSEYNNYVATHHHTDSEYDALEDERDALKAPKLVKVNLRSDDNRPWLGTPYLRVHGEMVNVGTNIAYDCKLHVVAYQGAVIAFDTYILLGAISGESWTSIDENLYYSGEALTDWNITPEWAS